MRKKALFMDDLKRMNNFEISALLKELETELMNWNIDKEKKIDAFGKQSVKRPFKFQKWKIRQIKIVLEKNG